MVVAIVVVAVVAVVAVVVVAVVVVVVVVAVIVVVGKIAHTQQVEITATGHCLTQPMFAAGSSQSLACCRRFDPSSTDLKRG